MSYYVAKIGNFLPTFRDNLILWVNPEDGTDRLSRNVCKKLLIFFAWKPRRVQFSATSRSGVPRKLFGGGGVVLQIQLRTEGRQNGDQGAVAP
jgi:hypothetical protein